MDRLRIHISQREAFKSDNLWIDFLKNHRTKFSTLIWREPFIDKPILSQLKQTIQKPIYINSGWVAQSVRLGKAFELKALMDYDGLHLKASEVSLLLGEPYWMQSFKAQMETLKALIPFEVGTSVHHLLEAEKAQVVYPFDYVLVSPIQWSQCKIGVTPLSVANREAILRTFKTQSPHTQMIALGGICLKDEESLWQLGFNGVAGRNQMLFQE